MREAFIEKAFRTKSIKLIKQANAIIDEMQAKGFTLTVRQLYYQFVARGLLENRQRNYSRLAATVDNARKAGLIDWSAIEDRTRYLRAITHYDSPADFIEQMQRYYAEDLWRDQDNYVEVWIEKDALLGVIQRVCNEWRVPYFACRGYASSSELYSAGKRLEAHMRKGRQAVILHLGDHDPSGLDMTRVNQESLDMFSRRYGIKLQRLALNMDQVEKYNPPPNPAKETDSRFFQYTQEYGKESWELDALDPEVIDKTIRDAIESLVDEDLFEEKKDLEDENESLIVKASENWDLITRVLKDPNGVELVLDDHYPYGDEDD